MIARIMSQGLSKSNLCIHNFVHEMVMTLIPIYRKEFVCTVKNQNNQSSDGYTAQRYNGFIREFH